MLALLLLTALIIIVKYRSRQGSFTPPRDVESHIQSEEEAAVIVPKYSTNPLESNTYSKSYRQEPSLSQISHCQSSEISPVAKLEDRTPEKIAKFSPQVDDKSPPVSLAWVVGIKATVIEIHELTLNFPAKCLRQERRINISVRRYIFEENPVYVYTITPHELIFDKPVSVQLNSKWKDPNSAFLRKRKSKNDDWITVGTFSDNSRVPINKFCDLCPTYQLKTTKLGEGFSFYNITVSGHRESRSHITLEVNLLANACKDTLQSQVCLLLGVESNLRRKIV